MWFYERWGGENVLNYAGGHNLIKWNFKSKNREPFLLWSGGDTSMEGWSLSLPNPCFVFLHSAGITVWQAECWLLKDVNTPIPRICEDVMLRGKGEFRFQGELSLLICSPSNRKAIFWIIPGDSKGSPGNWKVEEGRRGPLSDERLALLLLAVKTEAGGVSQRVQAASRNWKKEKDSLLQSLHQGSSLVSTLMSVQSDPCWTYSPQVLSLRCFRPLRLW